MLENNAMGFKNAHKVRLNRRRDKSRLYIY